MIGNCLGVLNLGIGFSRFRIYGPGALLVRESDNSTVASGIQFECCDARNVQFHETRAALACSQLKHYLHSDGTLLLPFAS